MAVRGEQVVFWGPNMNTNIIQIRIFGQIRIRIILGLWKWPNTCNIQLLKWPKTIQIFFVFEKQCPNLIENGKIGAKKWGKFFNFRIESSPCPVLTSVYKNFELSNKAIWRWAVFIVISEPNPNLNSNRFVKSTEYEYRYYLSQKLWPNMNIIWSKMFSWIRMAR